MQLSKNKNTIFIDLDGTLIDISKRYYTVYKNIAKSHIHGKVLSKNTYWNMRRSGYSFTKLLRQAHRITKVKFLKKKYLSMLESRDFLSLDSKFKGVENTLKYLRKRFYIVLVSLRSNRKNLKWQIKKIGLDGIFDDILSTASRKSGVETKSKLIKQSIYYKVNKKYVIGDTEADINSGHKTGCITIAVCSGIRNFEYLNNYSPHYIVRDILKLPKILRNNKILRSPIP